MTLDAILPLIAFVGIVAGIVVAVRKIGNNLHDHVMRRREHKRAHGYQLGKSGLGGGGHGGGRK